MVDIKKNCLKTRTVRQSLTGKLLATALVLFWLLVGAFVSRVEAQAISGSWSEPQNLSRSGASSQPLVLVDANGRAHIIWQDAVAGYVYTQGQADNWSPPIAVELPFGTRRFFPDLPDHLPTPLYTPILMTDPAGRAHSFWIDDQSTLFYSSVLPPNFSTFTSWRPAQQLAEAALSAAAAVDEAGRLHIAYVRPVQTDQFPAGTYYRRSNDGGATWTLPVLLQESPYLRSVPPELANVQVAASGTDDIVVAWDNRPLERVFMTRSGDGGSTWEEFTEVDRRLPADGVGSVGPSNIKLLSSSGGLHRIWLAGHEGQRCAQYHQQSLDGGRSWEPRQRTLQSLADCPTSTQPLAFGEGRILILAETAQGTSLSLWNGLRWSEPEFQQSLASFDDPQTFRPVDLSCLQTALIRGEELPETVIVVGCDDGVGEDIWLRSRLLSTFQDQLESALESQWRRPSLVMAGAAQELPELLSDSEGRVHLFWNERLSDESSTVRHAQWDGASWSTPADILRSRPGQLIAGPTFAVDGAGSVMAAWNSQLPGPIHFSSTSLERAGLPAEWTSPVQLPLGGSAATTPDLAVDAAGTIILGYTVPLNEGRGAYISRSTDRGESWSQPLRLFDAVAAGWDMVGPLVLAASPSGTLHGLWTQQTLPPATEAVALFYARSEDAGLSWSEAVEVIRSPVVWSQLLVDNRQAIHRLWQESDGSLWHQLSIDDGRTWEQVQRVSGPTLFVGAVGALVDRAGQVHLLQTGTEADRDGPGDASASTLLHWIWDGANWSAGTSLDLSPSRVTELAAVASSGGELQVVLTGDTFDPADGLETRGVLFTSLDLGLPSALPTLVPTLVPTLIPDETETPVAQPTTTPTVVFPTEPDGVGGGALPLDTGSPWTGPLLGIVPAGLVVLVAFFIGVRLLRGDRR